MSMVFISFSSVFVSLGLSSALIQKKNASEEHFSSSFFLNVFSACILAIVLTASAPLIAIFFKEPKIELIIQFLSLNLILSSLSVVAEIKLIKKLDFKILSKISISSSIISGIVALYLAFTGYGVWSLVSQVLLSGLIRTSLINYYSKWKPKLILKFSALLELWEYSFNLFISGLINTIYQQLDSLIIAKIFTPIELGLYTRAKSLNRFVIKYSSESIGRVAFPALSELNDRKSDMIKLGIKLESVIGFFCFGLLGLLYVTAEPLFLFVLGEKWKEAIPIYKILCFSGFVYPISASALNLLKASGDSKTFLNLEIYKKFIGITGLAIGFSFGLNGFLVSLIFSGLLSTILNFYFVSRSLNLNFFHQLYNSFVYIIPTIIAAIITLSISFRFDSIFLNLVCLFITYSILFLLINTLIKTKGYVITYKIVASYFTSLQNVKSD